MQKDASCKSYLYNTKGFGMHNLITVVLEHLGKEKGMRFKNQKLNFKFKLKEISLKEKKITLKQVLNKETFATTTSENLSELVQSFPIFFLALKTDKNVRQIHGK